jgi:hypothetical protein
VFAIIDLLHNLPICPNYYALAHTSSGWSGRITTWDLDASNDGVTWTTVRKHKGDQMPDSGAWPIENCNTFYRYFRIINRGCNTDGPQSFHMGMFLFKSFNSYIALGAFEIYGATKYSVSNQLVTITRQTKIWRNISHLKNKPITQTTVKQNRSQPKRDDIYLKKNDANKRNDGKSTQSCNQKLKK